MIKVLRTGTFQCFFFLFFFCFFLFFFDGIGACFHTDLEEYDGGEAEREPEFSLITGAFVPSRETSQTEEGNSYCFLDFFFFLCRVFLFVGIQVILWHWHLDQRWRWWNTILQVRK